MVADVKKSKVLSHETAQELGKKEHQEGGLSLVELLRQDGSSHKSPQLDFEDALTDCAGEV